MTIYLVPGLANDRRIFKNLSEELKDHDLIFLEHLEPINQEETISEYAVRLIKHHGEFIEDSIIIGFSLGGLISIEMAKIIKFKRIILISTIKHKSEFHPLIKAASNFQIHLPAPLIKNTIKHVALLLGVTNSDGANFISQIVNDSNEQHIVWAQKAASKWENRLIPDNYIHIHGTKDEIFPINYVKPSHKIVDGTHFMIMDRAKEVAQIIKSFI